VTYYDQEQTSVETQPQRLADTVGLIVDPSDENFKTVFSKIFRGGTLGADYLEVRSKENSQYYHWGRNHQSLVLPQIILFQSSLDSRIAKHITRLDTAPLTYKDTYLAVGVAACLTDSDRYQKVWEIISGSIESA